MTKRAKTVEPMYKVGEKLRLKNEWALQFSKDGVEAEVTDTRPGPDGEIIYNVLAQRPPIPCSVQEGELKK